MAPRRQRYDGRAGERRLPPSILKENRIIPKQIPEILVIKKGIYRSSTLILLDSAVSRRLRRRLDCPHVRRLRSFAVLSFIKGKTTPPPDHAPTILHSALLAFRISCLGQIRCALHFGARRRGRAERWWTFGVKMIALAGGWSGGADISTPRLCTDAADPNTSERGGGRHSRPTASYRPTPSSLPRSRSIATPPPPCSRRSPACLTSPSTAAPTGSSSTATSDAGTWPIPRPTAALPRASTSWASKASPGSPKEAL